MNIKELGYVYILTNPSFREDWVKIGKTTNMEKRLKTLNSTAFLLPFKVYATIKTSKYENGKPRQMYPVLEKSKDEKEKKPQRPLFDFSMVGLNVGDKVVFGALNLEVKVAGKNKVEYECRLWSLSAFCGTYLPERTHDASEEYQGPKYFSYQGKTLWEIRLENENNVL